MDAKYEKARRRAIEGLVPVAFSYFVNTRAVFWDNRTQKPENEELRAEVNSLSIG